MADSMELLMAVTNLVADLGKRSDRRIRQRSDPRISVDQEVELFSISASGNLKSLGTAWCMDVSYQGIGLISDFSLDSGQVLAVDLKNLVGQPLVLAIRMIHSRKINRVLYRSGGIFLYDQGHQISNTSAVAGTATKS